MKVIITGGEGFIGKTLAATLQKRGIEVVSIDRRNGIEAGEYFMANDLPGIDCVYHLAARTFHMSQKASLAMLTRGCDVRADTQEACDGLGAGTTRRQEYCDVCSPRPSGTSRICRVRLA